MTNTDSTTIDDSLRSGTILRLVAEMRRSRSWGGETHVQKSAFFLQHMLHVDLEYQFVLHLHGPYSFGLRDDLSRLRARRKLDVEPNPGYGASLSVDRSVAVDKLAGAEFDSSIQFVSEHISGRTVKLLERVATTYYLKFVSEHSFSDQEVPDELQRLKPHITEHEASIAVDEVKELMDMAAKILSPKDT